jgi:methylmalonyl-CoA mutase C-terminal domain/subunit
MNQKRSIRILLAKVGLDGHDRGIKVVATGLRDAGFEIIYAGRHQSPEQVVSAAIQEDADFIGVSNLSSSYKELLTRIKALLKEQGADDKKLLLGGIIVDEDIPVMEKMGVKVFRSGTKMQEIVEYIKENA